MSTSVDEQQFKTTMREVIVEMLEEKNTLLYEVITDAIEEIALSHAIADGRNDDFVDESAIFSALDS